MQLLRHRTLHDATRRERGRMLRMLLEDDVSASDAHAVLGIDTASPCAVAGFRIAVDDDVELSLKRARAVDLITVACEAFRRRVVCTWIGPTVYALFPAMTTASLERVAAMATDICSRSPQTLGVDMLAGISAIGPDLARASELRAEADRVLRVLGGGSTGRLAATLDEVRVPAILQSLADVVAERPDLRLPGVDVLRRHDAEHGKAFVPTLRAFVDAGGDVGLAAKALQVHPNTVRYRLKRVSEITGLDVESAADRLVIALALLPG
jgi:sugar diacid utilization regulator